jgi:hypothetical protein
MFPLEDAIGSHVCLGSPQPFLLRAHNIVRENKQMFGTLPINMRQINGNAAWGLRLSGGMKLLQN